MQNDRPTSEQAGNSEQPTGIAQWGGLHNDHAHRKRT